MHPGQPPRHPEPGLVEVLSSWPFLAGGGRDPVSEAVETNWNPLLDAGPANAGAPSKVRCSLPDQVTVTDFDFCSILDDGGVGTAYGEPLQVQARDDGRRPGSPGEAGSTPFARTSSTG